MLARPGALSPHAQSGDWIENEPEGSPPMGRENSRRDLVFGWARRDPDHEAAIRFDGEAPGRRAHSSVGIAAMGSLRLATPIPIAHLDCSRAGLVLSFPARLGRRPESTLPLRVALPPKGMPQREGFE